MTLELAEVAVRYGERVALQNTSLRLEPGGVIGLVGPNGAGKSSLLKALAGLVPTRGRIAWCGAALEHLKPRARARTIAYLPQTQDAHWPMRAEDLVALGRLPHRAFAERASREDAAAVAWALDQCDAARFARRSVDELSGGERARVLLARALAVRAPVLLVDEPIQSLDPYHQLDIMTALHSYAAAGGLVIAVLHDIALAARFCARTILLHEGTVVGDGAPAAVLSVAALERYYHVHPYLAEHEGSLVIVPWCKLGHRDRTGPQ